MADSNRRPVSLNVRHYRLLQDQSAPPKPSSTQKEEEKPSMVKMEGRRRLCKASSKENVDHDEIDKFSGITDFDSPPTVKEEAKPVKVKMEGRRRLCKVSSQDNDDAGNRVVADVPKFSVITDLDSPSPQLKNVNESNNNRDSNEIRDILNDLSSRLEFLSIEKKKAPKRNGPGDGFSGLVKEEEADKDEKFDLPEYTSAESSFSLTLDPSDSSSDATKKVEATVENLVHEHEEDGKLQNESKADNFVKRTQGTKNNVVVERKNEPRKVDEKLASVGQSFVYNVEEEELWIKSDGVDSAHRVDEIKENSRKLKKIEAKGVHERIRSVGRSFLSNLREEEDDDSGDCVLLSGKKVVEVKRHGDKFKKSNRSCTIDVLDDYGDECAPEDEGSITLKDSKSAYMLQGKIAKMLYPHQCEGLRWLWSLHCQGKGGILGDDMGLGKTMQICGFLAGLFHSRLIKRALVVAPKTLLSHWIKELSVVGLFEKTREYFGTCAKAREYELQYILQDKGVLLTTYDIVRNNSKSLRGNNYFSDDDGEDSITWDYMILDEGHLIKNPSTQRAKSLLEIPSAHRIIISGTPIQNNLKELWALFNFCCPGLLGDKNWFKETYEHFILRGNEKNASDREKRIGSTVAKELRERIQPYFLRRLKNEVFCENAATTVKLSKKNEIIVWLRLTSCQRQLYEAFLKSEIVLSAFDGSPLAALTILKKICDHPLLLTKRAAEDVLEGMDSVDSTLNPEEAGLAEKLAMHIADVAETDDFHERHGSVSCKLSFILSLLDNLIPEGHHVLIFSQTRKMLNLIQESLIPNRYKFLRIDGTTKASDRVKIVNDFQEGNAAPIFLLTSQVGGLGLTLTKADRVIVVDPAWNPSTDNQSVDRAYRIGQNKDVVVYRLMSCGTVEEKIYRKQIYKGGLFKTATEHKEQIRYFSQQDLQELFSLPKQGFDVSLTQQQLHEEHDCHHKMDDTLEAHISFLETLGIAGVSHHSLLFSKTAPIQVVHEEEEEIRRKGTTLVGPSSSSSSLERSVDGAECAFNPKDVKLNKISSSPDSPGKLTESAIKERINRLSQIFANKITVSRLPDKGAKLQKQIAELKSALHKIRMAESTEKQVIDVVDLTGELQRVLNA